MSTEIIRRTSGVCKLGEIPVGSWYDYGGSLCLKIGNHTNKSEAECGYAYSDVVILGNTKLELLKTINDVVVTPVKVRIEYFLPAGVR